jgi:poly-gamma-glutamate capsule biosynthesis protein CapA/YwtB (metallophosphatase superfamily)
VPRRAHRKKWNTFTALTAVTATAVGAGLLLYGLILKYDDAAAGSSAQPPASAGPTVTAAPRQLTILGAGDIIVHPPVWEQARADNGGSGYDFFPIFEGVSQTISAADLALCHLETPVAAAGATPAGYPLFNVPPEILDGIKKAGFDGCSTASNHILDKGTDGLLRTLNAMEKIGLGQAGSARTAEEAGQTKLYDVRGIKVGHLSYTYGLGRGTLPAGKEWMVNVINPEAVKAAARKAREAKADVVVVSMQWGTEYDHGPNPDQERWAKELLASPDIDLILGHNTHSVQAIEKVGEKWVVYGMGNEVARHSENYDKSREGIMARMTLTETEPGKWRVTKAEAIATWTQLTPQVRILELPKVLAGQSLSATARRTYQATLDRIAGYLRLRGADGSGLLIDGLPGNRPSASAGASASPAAR